MGVYRYTCKAAFFGCQCSRSRKTSIQTHEGKCEIVKKFRKYLDLEAENAALKSQIEQLTKTRGRPQIKIKNVNIEKFFKTFMQNKRYIAAWKILFGNKKQNAIPALFRLFLAVSPRFFKLQPCKKMIEIRGYFGEIQTKNEIHCYPVNDFGYAVFIYLADSVEDYIEDLGYTRSDVSAMNIPKILKMNQDNRNHTAFVRNSVIYETMRRANGLPVKLNSVEIDIDVITTKK